MTTFGITRSKNEDDIIEGSIRRALTQVDHVIIGDNSTDNTRKILEGLVDEGLPIALLDDWALNVEQRDVMTDYAGMAAWMGAHWVIPFDIDEVWFSPNGARITDNLAELPDNVMVVDCSNTTHCATSEDDPNEADPITRMGWRSADKLPLAKVACRCRPDLKIGHGNHTANYDGPIRTVQDIIEIRHYPYRTPEQFIKRVQGAWPSLRDSGLPESHGAHMWAYGRCLDAHGPDGLVEWFKAGMFFEDPASNPELIFDPCPVTLP